MNPQRMYDEAKFKELLLYVADKMSDDPSFGATKLNKVLFFSDFFAYGQWGKSITGATYQKLPKGPAPRELLAAQGDLQTRGRAMVVPVQRFNFTQKRLIALQQADLSAFSGAEIALVDRVIETLRPSNATEVSDLSHKMALGWQMASDNEEIPYETVFLSTKPLTSVDITRGQEVAKRYGLSA